MFTGPYGGLFSGPFGAAKPVAAPPSGGVPGQLDFSDPNQSGEAALVFGDETQ